MLTIPIQWQDGKRVLLIVLEAENLKRIQEYDPAEIDVRKLAEPFRSKAFHQIAVMYATPEEIGKVMEMLERGEVNYALHLLARGWKYRPEEGDHDQAYISLLRKGHDA